MNVVYQQDNEEINNSNHNDNLNCDNNWQRDKEQNYK
ncbi:hypothetical protein T4B_13095 [Trichinella pseudospiralis]|uniref:Uncharacterized protein n=1 Tax=Trichinella pseudospiralis TaxID=6337 RepID=A0A0V1GL61_TRIPS|nr:hypothetical protein T4B_13095 [Trichinella pseudospiralis]KRZ06807.1 hypothetical protein T4C_5756 [Trichinella pseudospiralis]KRZ09722.1 hypothetical protein T4C_11743 [Trichinella pseudospiralis]